MVSNKCAADDRLHPREYLQGFGLHVGNLSAFERIALEKMLKRSLVLLEIRERLG